MTPWWKCSLKYFCVLGNGAGTAVWWLLHTHSLTRILGNDTGGKAVPTHLRLTTKPQCYRPTTSQEWLIGIEAFSEDDKQMDVQEKLLYLLRDYSSVASLGSQHWSCVPSHPILCIAQRSLLGPVGHQHRVTLGAQKFFLWNQTLSSLERHNKGNFSIICKKKKTKWPEKESS